MKATPRQFAYRLYGVANRTFPAAMPLRWENSNSNYEFMLDSCLSWLNENEFKASAQTSLLELQCFAFDPLDALELLESLVPGAPIEMNWFFQIHCETLIDYITWLSNNSEELNGGSVHSVLGI